MSANNSAPGACVTMPWYECRDGIFEIDEFDCASCFVVVGQERALILDTGVGIGDLKWLIEHCITDKPYDVVATHNHGDHIGGAGWFDSIWMHPKDADGWDTKNAAPTLEFRRGYAQLIRKRENKHYAYDPGRDIRPWPCAPVIRGLADGQQFDLGGRVVTALHCPGHTSGEMVLIDSGTRTLLCGDACNCNWLLDTSLAPTGRGCVEQSLAALRKIEALCGTGYDAGSVFNFHHDFRGFGQPLAPDVLPDLIRCLGSLLDGTAVFREVRDPLSGSGAAKTVAEYGRVQVSCMGQDIRDVV